MLLLTQVLQFGFITIDIDWKARHSVSRRFCHIHLCRKNLLEMLGEMHPWSVSNPFYACKRVILYHRHYVQVLLVGLSSLVPRLPKSPHQCYSNRMCNLDNLGRSKEIQLYNHYNEHLIAFPSQRIHGQMQSLYIFYMTDNCNDEFLTISWGCSYLEVTVFSHYIMLGTTVTTLKKRRMNKGHLWNGDGVFLYSFFTFLTIF